MKLLTCTEYASRHDRTAEQIKRLIRAGRMPEAVTEPVPGHPNMTRYMIPSNTPWPELQKPGMRPGSKRKEPSK